MVLTILVAVVPILLNYTHKEGSRVHKELPEQHNYLSLIHMNIIDLIEGEMHVVGVFTWMVNFISQFAAELLISGRIKGAQRIPKAA